MPAVAARKTPARIPIDTNHDLLSRTAAANYIGVSERTLWRIEARRTGPPRIQIGGTCLYRRATLDAWLGGIEGRGRVATVPTPRERRRKTR